MNGLINISGKPIEKLIDMACKGLGALYRPRAIRKEADAKAYEIKVLERARHEAAAEGKLIEAENLRVIEERFLAREQNRQNNIDNVIELAAADLQSCESVSEKPVEKDWLTRYFDIVQDISDEEMQTLWARILSGEVRQPGSFSLRTMELLRNLTREEAETFVRLAPFVLRSSDRGYYIVKLSTVDQKELGIHYADLALLTEVGILQSGELVSLTITLDDMPNHETFFFNADKLVIRVFSRDPKVPIRIPIVPLSRVGMELLHLIQVTPNVNFLKAFAKSIKQHYLTIEYSEVVSESSDSFIYKRPAIPL